jgi:anti-sigma B factor antagonist
MKITTTMEGNLARLALEGRLDTVTSSQLATELGHLFEGGALSLIFDFRELEYISSAGLRVLLTAQKKVKSLGTALEIVNANESVKEVFDITGFSGILTIS